MKNERGCRAWQPLFFGERYLNQDSRDKRMDQDLGRTRIQGIGGWAKIDISSERH